MLAARVGQQCLGTDILNSLPSIRAKKAQQHPKLDPWSALVAGRKGKDKDKAGRVGDPCQVKPLRSEQKEEESGCF